MVPHLEPGERFATTDDQGRTLIWMIGQDGLVRLQPGQFASEDADDTRDLIMAEEGPGSMLTVTQAANWLGVGARSVWNYMARGDLPWVKVGKYRRIPRTGLDEFVRTRESSS